MNRCDECLSLIDFYLDDELRDDDLGVYKDQLDQCVSCRQELEERRLFLERVRSSRPLHVASGTFRNRLSQMLDQESWPNVEEIRPVISPSKRRP